MTAAKTGPGPLIIRVKEETDVHWELYNRGYIFVHRYKGIHQILRGIVARMSREGKLKMVRRTSTGWTYVAKNKFTKEQSE